MIQEEALRREPGPTCAPDPDHEIPPQAPLTLSPLLPPASPPTARRPLYVPVRAKFTLALLIGLCTERQTSLVMVTHSDEAARAMGRTLRLTKKGLV